MASLLSMFLLDFTYIVSQYIIIFASRLLPLKIIYESCGGTHL